MGSTRPDGGDDPLDALFAVLADGRRRRVLQYLRSADGDAVSTDDLVDGVLERGGTTDGREVVQIKFRHATLPRLEEAGYIEHDTRSGAVRYREDPLLERALDLAAELEAET